MFLSSHDHMAKRSHYCIMIFYMTFGVLLYRRTPTLIFFYFLHNSTTSNTCQSHSVPPQSHYSCCYRCQRLRPTVLVYPWQGVQDELLQGMIDAGSVAVMIKVTGIDLVEKHSGKTLTEMQPILMKLVRFLCNIPSSQRGRRGIGFIV